MVETTKLQSNSAL